MGTLSLALTLQGEAFNINQRNKRTGNTLLQILLSTLTMTTFRRAEFRPIAKHKELLLNKIKREAIIDGSKNRLKQTVLHTVCDSLTYRRVNMLHLKRYQERSFQAKVDAAKLAGEPAPLRYSYFSSNRNRNFSSMVLKLCMKRKLDVMKADSQGAWPLLELAKSVKKDLMQASDFTQFITHERYAAKIDLNRADKDGNTVLHFLFSKGRIAKEVVDVLYNSPLLPSVDLSAINAEGLSIESILAKNPHSFTTISRLPGQPYWQRQYTANTTDLCERLVNRWNEVAMPTITKRLNRHLITDLTAIVATYIIGEKESNSTKAKKAELAVQHAEEKESASTNKREEEEKESKNTILSWDELIEMDLD